MTEEEKRYKIMKIESYQTEKKEYNTKARKAFGKGIFALGNIVLGVGGLLEFMNLPSDVSTNFIMIALSGMFAGGSIVEMVQIKSLINSIKNKVKLDGRIEEINEELDLLDEQTSSKSRGGR